MGSTGSLWPYEQLPARPDEMTTAKPLGRGLPDGACVTAPETGDVLAPGDHGSTFAGGPLVASAALAAFDVLDDPELLRGVREIGGRLREGLEGLAHVDHVRGRGLMLGVALVEGVDAPEVQSRLLDDGLVVNSTDPHTLRLLPPLVIGEAEVEIALGRFRKALG
jgi:acetylornithine/N-succinyldiaminopimelate aminotransferase